MLWLLLARRYRSKEVEGSHHDLVVPFLVHQLESGKVAEHLVWGAVLPDPVLIFYDLAVSEANLLLDRLDGLDVPCSLYCLLSFDSKGTPTRTSRLLSQPRQKQGNMPILSSNY